MPNVVKYSLTTQANTLKKGNVVLGMNSVEYGPTSATGFWNGIEIFLGTSKGPNVGLFKVPISQNFCRFYLGCAQSPVYVWCSESRF